MSKIETEQAGTADSSTYMADERRGMVIKTYAALNFGAIGCSEAPLTFHEQSLEGTDRAIPGRDRP